MISRRYDTSTLWGVRSFVFLAMFSFSLGCDSPILDESLNESQTQKIPSGWTRVDQLTGGRVNTIFVNGLDIYVGREASGISFSDDGGLNWRSINTNLNEVDESGEPSLWRKRIKAFAKVGETIFAGMETGGWISGYDNDYVGGVFVLSSEGRNWERIGLKEQQVSSLAVIDSNLFAGTDSGVYLLKRNDNAWSVERIGLSDLEITSLAVIDKNLFASAHNDIYRTDDLGINWKNVKGGWPDYIRVYSLLAIGQALIAGTSDGVFLSESYGASWTAENEGIPHNDAGVPYIASMVQTDSFLLASGNSSCVVYDPGGTICTKSGLLLSGTHSMSWEFIEFEGLDPFPVGVVDGKILVGISRGGMYGSETNEVWMNTYILNGHER